MFNLACGFESTSIAMIDPGDVRQVMHDVFEAMLDRLVAATDDRSEPLLDTRLNACVQIAGAWQGAIVLETTLTFARRAASIVFELPPDDVSNPDVNDALAELTNMIGGNIKALLPGPSMLSLPAVTEGRDFLLSLPGAKPIYRANFVCEMEHIGLLICEKTTEPAGRKQAAH